MTHSEKWLYRLDHPVTWRSGHPFPHDMAFNDLTGTRRLEITSDGAITVLAGYAWDGCTPKFNFFDVLFGTPDGVVDTRTGRPKTYYASLYHDALYQFLGTGLPLRRVTVDRFFLRLMTATDFRPRSLYFAAVRLFGNLFRRTAKYAPRNRGHRVPLEASLATGQGDPVEVHA